MQTVIVESHGWEFRCSAHSIRTTRTDCSWLCLHSALYFAHCKLDVTGWGCDRVWAETVCHHQLTLHSGTPSVGPTLASLSSVCGVPSLLARDAEN